MNKSIFVCVATALAFVSWTDPGFAHDAKIDVLRGGNAESVTTDASSGLVVLKGSGSKYLSGKADYAVTRPQSWYTRYQMMAGSGVWLLDRKNGEVTRCGWRGTGYVGGWRVVCRTGSIY